MPLLIFESIGMSELLLIGIVALIVFGPRKLPQIARKAGKTMTELRKVTNEFKDTWQKEVELSEANLDKSEKAIPQASKSSSTTTDDGSVIEMPSVSAAPTDSFESHRMPETTDAHLESVAEDGNSEDPGTSKRDWF